MTPEYPEFPEYTPSWRDAVDADVAVPAGALIGLGTAIVAAPEEASASLEFVGQPIVEAANQVAEAVTGHELYELPPFEPATGAQAYDYLFDDTSTLAAPDVATQSANAETLLNVFGYAAIVGGVALALLASREVFRKLHYTGIRGFLPSRKKV